MTGTLTVREAGARTEPAWEELHTALAPVLAGRGLRVDIASLGVRDELSVPARELTDDLASGGGETHPDGSTVSLRFYGHLAVLGPVRPSGAARPCGQCLNRRWQVVRSKELRDALELGGRTCALDGTPYLTPFAVETLGRLLAWLAESPGLRDPYGAVGSATVVLLDLRSLRSRAFRLTADPECPVCAEATVDDERHADWELPRSAAPAGGGFRLRSLDDLQLDEEALANPVCGVLGPGVVREYDSPTTASTYGRMDLRSGTYLHETFWGGHTLSYRDSARVGLLEGLERYAGMRSRARVTSTEASLRELRESGRRALDPRDCGVYSEEFYARDPRRVAPFTEDRTLPWVWGRSLRDGAPVLVPELLTYYHSVPLAERFVQECSNGCASGSTLTEAVHFGLMELIERDAFLLAWYGGLALPEIDGGTSRSAATRALIDRLALHGYRARFFDARVSFGVPVVIAVAERVDGGPGTLAFGAGASPDPEQALRAALVEIATDAPHLPRRVAWNLDRLAPMVDDFDRVLGLHDHPLLYGLPGMRRHAEFLLADRGRRSLAETYADLDERLRPAGDPRAVVDACVAMLAGAGFDVIAVDQSLALQRESGLSTAGVIVPGLLPIDFGWSRQRALGMPRLRTAPRLAGLTDRDLTEADLNRAPHPFP
ncbi:bacteriocin biosynthesis protein SagD [Streptomyces albofaciens JCM 4342]|uniref:TOMM precursor leader peptide-binding protein n=1 Tax=Streptomyces albofaciens TaxID=66866 RepID=UPI0012385647|nr:TOMM precursor leader peptide-binding protein [Streptomyces albofaciens]KAA6223208.1 bacteriocin biosynthesis protein SagD [Streptomyces albofaciens JCM 4342]